MGHKHFLVLIICVAFFICCWFFLVTASIYSACRRTSCLPTFTTFLLCFCKIYFSFFKIWVIMLRLFQTMPFLSGGLSSGAKTSIIMIAVGGSLILLVVVTFCLYKRKNLHHLLAQHKIKVLIQTKLHLQTANAIMNPNSKTW